MTPVRDPRLATWSFLGAIAILIAWPTVAVVAMFGNLQMQMSVEMGPIRVLNTIGVGLVPLSAAWMVLSQGHARVGQLIVTTIAVVEACLWSVFIMWAGLGAAYSCWTPLCGV